MKNKKLLRFFLAGFLIMSFSLSGFCQECDQYLNKQTNTVNTKDIVQKVLKVFGKTADVIFGTNFSSLTRSTDQLQLLDNIQYQNCLKLQTIKNEFNRENLEARVEQTLREMVKLINQSGTLPPDVVKQLVANGTLSPSQAQTNAITGTITPATAANANDVPVPILPVPDTGNWNTVTFPCQSDTTPPTGVIRAHGMESSMDPQIAKSIAHVIALEELASKIEVAVKCATQYFIDRTETNLSEELGERFERKIELSVNQTIRGYRNICEEYRQHSQTQKYQYFVSIEINEDTALKPVYDELQQEPGLQNAVPNYGKFKETINQVFRFFEKTGMN